MPPSNFGARASTAMAWHARGSPIGCAPASSISRSGVPVLYGVPRTMKLSAASPQASFSHDEVGFEPSGREHDGFALDMVRAEGGPHDDYVVD